MAVNFDRGWWPSFCTMSRWPATMHKIIPVEYVHMQWPWAKSMNYVSELCWWPMAIAIFFPKYVRGICACIMILNLVHGKAEFGTYIELWPWIMAVDYLHTFCPWLRQICERPAARSVVDVHESSPWNMVMDVKDIALIADYVRRLCHWFKIMECGHRYVTCRHDHISCQWSLSVFLVRELCAWKLLMGFVRTKYDLGLCAWEYCMLLCAYRRFTDDGPVS